MGIRYIVEHDANVALFWLVMLCAVMWVLLSVKFWTYAAFVALGFLGVLTGLLVWAGQQDKAE
jgi:hypothetical protein